MNSIGRDTRERGAVNCCCLRASCALDGERAIKVALAFKRQIHVIDIIRIYVLRVQKHENISGHQSRNVDHVARSANRLGLASGAGKVEPINLMLHSFTMRRAHGGGRGRGGAISRAARPIASAGF